MSRSRSAPIISTTVDIDPLKQINPLVNAANRGFREDLTDYPREQAEALNAISAHPAGAMLDVEDLDDATVPISLHPQSNPVGVIRNWFEIQKAIRVYAQKSYVRDWKVTASINNFRLSLWQVQHKDFSQEQQLWNQYDNYFRTFTTLSETTANSRLYLKPYPDLVELRDAWDELLRQQKYIISLFTGASEAVITFDIDRQLKLIEEERKRREFEDNVRLSTARKSLGKTLAWVNSIERKEVITRGAKVLSLEAAQKAWALRLKEISDLESQEDRDIDHIIALMSHLDQRIQTAPMKAMRVNELERDFYNVIDIQEELSTYQRTVIPKPENTSKLTLMEEKIPRFWANGDWAELDKALDEISEFIKKYDVMVRSELIVKAKRDSGSLEGRRRTSILLPRLSTGNSIRQFMPMIRTLVNAIDARDTYMAGHSDLVAKYSLAIARKLGWEQENLEEIEIAALLHDVGKVSIPEHILTKTERLTNQEWETIRLHPYYGAKIIKPIEPLNSIIPWVYHHQERWDGRGYPDKLSGKRIPIAARIISAAEAFTAILAGNFNRAPMTPQHAIQSILADSESAFDPEIAEALADVVQETVVHEGGPTNITSELKTRSTGT
jgi:HD-GYP domain-containing protein (c-di-GMP phosphodiesterase class II)